MKVDPKKVLAYLERPGMFLGQAMPMQVEPEPEVEVTPEEVEEIQEELADDMSEAAQLQRKLSYDVKYMEVSEAAGAFSCGNCRYATEEGVCLNAMVRAPVDAEHGCCNLYEPKEETGIKLLFPPPKGEDGEDQGNYPNDDEEEAEEPEGE